MLQVKSKLNLFSNHTWVTMILNTYICPLVILKGYKRIYL